MCDVSFCSAADFVRRIVLKRGSVFKVTPLTTTGMAGGGWNLQLDYSKSSFYCKKIIVSP